MAEKPLHVLCVDDDPDTCALISNWLRSAQSKYTLTAVTSADEAVPHIATRNADLYILDSGGLGHLSGVDLTHLIRENDPDTPILFFTGRSLEADKIRALKAGASDYLVKPVDGHLFVETVERLTRRSGK